MFKAFRNIVTWSDDEDTVNSKTETRKKSAPFARKPSMIRPKNSSSGGTGKSKGIQIDVLLLKNCK